jgi:hypothetical protein
MPAAALARGRVLDPLEILLESLTYVHRDVSPFTNISLVAQFDKDVEGFVRVIKKVLSHRATFR